VYDFNEGPGQGTEQLSMGIEDPTTGSEPVLDMSLEKVEDEDDLLWVDELSNAGNEEPDDVPTVGEWQPPTERATSGSFERRPATMTISRPRIDAKVDTGTGRFASLQLMSVIDGKKGPGGKSNRPSATQKTTEEFTTERVRMVAPRFV